MLSLETARKLKEAGLKWEPKLGDWYYYESFYTRKWEPTVIESEAEENAKCFLEADLFISAPRLDQLLAEIEKRGWKWSIVPSRNRYRLILTTVKQFVSDSPEEAAAAALLWIIE